MQYVSAAETSYIKTFSKVSTRNLYIQDFYWSRGWLHYLFIYSRTPEIATADLSQFYAGLNLSQFHTDCLLRLNSSAAILHYLNEYLAL